MSIDDFALYSNTIKRERKQLIKNRERIRLKIDCIMFLLAISATYLMRNFRRTLIQQFIAAKQDCSYSLLLYVQLGG